MLSRRPTQLRLIPTPTPAKASLRSVIDIRQAIDASLEVITAEAPERLEDVYATVQYYRRDLRAQNRVARRR